MNGLKPLRRSAITGAYVLVMFTAATFPLSTHAQTSVSSAANTTTINLTVTNGCRLNSSTATSGISLGVLDFGQTMATATAVDAETSGANNGIYLRCTPGTTVAIKINAGLYGTGTTRHMRRAGFTTNLTYQIYKDVTRSQIWDNTSGIAHTFADDDEVYFPIYGRVLAQATPPAGVYTDTLVVTVEY